MSSQNLYTSYQVPDLSLARTPDVASGSPLASMPIPLPDIPRAQPMLQSSNPAEDVHLMGIVDAVPFHDLSLAQTPTSAAAEMVPSINAPTFTDPSALVPPLLPYDLQTPSIDHVPEFTPDPQVGDLLVFEQPHGLTIYAASINPLLPDTVTPDLSAYGRPDGLVMPSVELVDPSLPDLQSPDLLPAVTMSNRPAEMGAALGDSSMDVGNDDEHAPLPPYVDSFLTPNLSRRQRHLDALYRGLQGTL